MPIYKPGEFTDTPHPTGIVIPKGQYADSPPAVRDAVSGPPLGVGEAFKQGFAEQPISKSSTIGEKAAHFAGEAAPLVAGGVFGPIGVAGAEALRKGVTQLSGMAPVQSSVEIGAGVIGAGALQAAGEAAAPVIAAGAAKAGNAVGGVTDWLASKIGKSFLKGAKVDFAYGHDPVKALTDEGIIATSWDDLLSKVKLKKHELGEFYDNLFTSGKDMPANVDLSGISEPIDKAITENKLLPDKALAKGLNTLKNNLDKYDGEVSTEQAYTLKKYLYKVTKFNATKSDEAIVNKVKQQVAGIIDDKVKTAIPELAEVDKRYANLSSLENIVTNRQIVAQRSDFVGLPEYIGGASYLAGGGALPSAALAVAGRALKSPLGGTLAANALAKISKAELTPMVESLAGKLGGAFSQPLLERAIKQEATDHPTIPREHLPTLVSDELKADPHFYDKE